MAAPTLSIITVTYNAENYLERTIRSVIGQTYPPIEYIIVDGQSTDRTVAIIRQYEKHITRWISEPDAGLYDAMNKGLKMATGDYVWFMNAGDELYDATTAQRIADKFPQNGDVYYGDALFVDGTTNQPVGLRSAVTPHKLPRALTWHAMQMGMVVCHQSFIARRTVAPPYDLAHPYCADVDWEIECLKRAKTVVFVDAPLCRYLTGGFSRKNLQQSWLDRFAVLRHHFGTARTLLNHVRISLRGVAFARQRGGKYW